MLRLLRERRWQGFTAAAVLAIVAFGMLSLWQWHRAEEKRAEFVVVDERINSAAITPDVADPRPELEWQHVQMTGTFDPAAQFLVRNRPLDGANGFWVVTALRTPEGVTWVVRGWMPTSTVAGATAEAPAPPTGEVAVEGYARLSDTEPARRAGDIPPGQATAVNTHELSQLAQLPPDSAWYVLASADPELVPIDTPEPTDSRNLSYAVQWLLFAGITIGGWFFFLRREANTPMAPAPEEEPHAARPG